MALNKIYQYTEKDVRERVVPSGTKAGTPLLINSRPAVALTSRGDATTTQAVAGNYLTSVTYKVGGASNAADSASVAYDGTYEFPVATATTSTANDVEVFITAGGTLTLVSTSNTHYGWTDYPVGYRKTAGRAAVRVGK